MTQNDLLTTQTNIEAETTKIISISSNISIPDVVETAIPSVVSVVISANVPVIERYYEDFWSPFDSSFGGNGFGF